MLANTFSMTSAQDPFVTNADGSAKDAAAFRQALLADSEKMAALENEPEVLKVVRGQDLQAFQELLKTVFAVSIPAFFSRESNSLASRKCCRASKL